MWICRMWTDDGYGWTSDFESFDNEQEAKEMGEMHLRLSDYFEDSRDYEVYRKEIDE